MNRFFALIGALFLSFVTIASACAAVAPGTVHFTLRSEKSGDRIQVNFRSDPQDSSHNSWSSGFRPGDLAGLDLAGFRAGGTRPLRFSLIREAGWIDCSGRGGGSYADGDCSLALNPEFIRLLDSHGIARPRPDQAFGLVVLDVRRDLIDALAAARYPTPSVGDLMGLTALGVDRGYIAGLAGVGYRPNKLGDLMQFRALNITPQWIAGFVRTGYAGLPADELVQLKALNVTPDYIAGFDRLGYRRLPAHTLVELKAMGITPEFVRSVADDGQPMPDVSKLIEMKIFGRRR
jgi:hypothetical protein